MAGFGSVSLVQTAVGMLLDQRAIVLYKQPKDDIMRELTKQKGDFTQSQINIYIEKFKNQLKQKKNK